MTILTIHIDGGSRGNPGPAGAGVVIADESGQPIHEGAYFLDVQTNNAAEYLALVMALKRVHRFTAEAVKIHADSELLVKQVTGEYQVRNPRLAELYEDVQRLLIGLPRWQIRHVKREGNCRADELANLAMDRGHDVIVTDLDDGPSEGGQALLNVPPPEGRAPNSPLTPSDAASDEAESAWPVRCEVADAPAAGDCPAGGCGFESIVVRAKLPGELCVYAAHALLPTILAIRSTTPDEIRDVPTMTVRCSHAGCGARFRVAPEPAENGRH